MLWWNVFFSQAYFYNEKVHIKWDVIISSSLRLIMKVWIWIENYYLHREEQLGFYKKSAYQNTEHEQKEECSSNFTPQMSFNLFDKKCAQENCIFNMEKVDLEEL